MTMMRNRSPLLHLSLINVASDIPRFMATRHSDDNIGKKFVPTAATKPLATAASVLWKDMLHLLNRQLRAHNTTFWVCMRKMRFCSENSRNFLFGLENGSDHTPIPPVRDIVKQFSSGPPPTVREPNQHRRNCPIFRHFCNTSPSPNLLSTGYRC